MNDWIRRLLYDFQFLTRLPINVTLPLTPEDPAKGMALFPVVAAVVGITSSALGGLIYYLTGSALAAALFSVLGSVCVTGGLHLDGLSDVCDGIYSGRSRERMLEIMHDSRMGSFGGAALFFDLSVRTVLMMCAYQKGLWLGLAAAYAAPLAGRMGILMISLVGKSAREGMGKCYVTGMTPGMLFFALALSAALALPGGFPALSALGLSLLVALIQNVYLTRKLGGITGDCLGATNELCEMAALCLFALRLVG